MDLARPVFLNLGIDAWAIWGARPLASRQGSEICRGDVVRDLIKDVIYAGNPISL